jgi:LysM repeat protein
VHHIVFFMDPKLSRRQILFGVGAFALGLASCTRRTANVAPPPPPLGRPLAPVPVQGGLWYTVQPGNTLSSISRRSGLSVKEIIASNKLRSSLIKPGQRLFLPGAKTLVDDPLGGRLARDPDLPPPKRSPGSGSKSSGPRYRVVRRKEWTDAKIKKNHRQMGRVTRITVHHTGEYAGTVGVSKREILRRIDRYHREGRGWAAIGYHWLVSPDGQVYEGRPESIQGAHTRNANSNNLGISMMGDFHKNSPTARHVSILKAVLEDARKRYGLPRSKVFGHRDHMATACPGDHLYAWLQRYKAGNA